MNNYWQEHFNLNSDRFENQLYKQVGKTVDGKEINEGQIDLIIAAIVNNLKLNQFDKVIDLCCGNGLLTKKISLIVKEVVGVDFSKNLIGIAKLLNKAYNIGYNFEDILNLDSSFFKGQVKIFMYEGLQHLSPDDIYNVLSKLQISEGKQMLFIGGIPDKQKLVKYYDTNDKFNYYLQCEKEGRPHMGRWWNKDEITRIAAKTGFRATYLRQDSSLYTSYYRFDCVLEKI
jgi:2-polyprenyl-3-methyl-5-hydroxy-6-metoxy-1,4-benzoquinol methylase